MRTADFPTENRLRSEVAERLTSVPEPGSESDFEERCRTYLQDLRWPEGVACPRCEESSRLLWLESRSKWHCYSCRYQFSVTAGTLFHNSHLPVWKWFVAVHVMLESPSGVSANELKRIMGGSYKTAWFAAHRIRAAMRGRGEELLRGLVEAESKRSPVAVPAVDGLWTDDAATLASSLRDRGHESVVARVRRVVAGPHHPLSLKYLPAYIDEHRWRSANRSNPNVFRDTILALLNGEGLSYEQLVATK